MDEVKAGSAVRSTEWREEAYTPASQVPFAATLQVRDACLCLHAQRAARAMARRFDEAFRPLGLTSGQFSLIMSLNRPEPASLGSVARLLAVDRTTLTAALKPLQGRGLVAVAVDARDRRGRQLALTPAGTALLARALPIWQRTQTAIAAALTDGDRLRGDLRVLDGFATQTAAEDGCVDDTLAR